MDNEAQPVHSNQPVVFHNTKEDEEPPKGEQVYVFFRTERHVATFNRETRQWHLTNTKQIIPEAEAGAWAYGAPTAARNEPLES